MSAQRRYRHLLCKLDAILFCELASYSLIELALPLVTILGNTSATCCRCVYVLALGSSLGLMGIVIYNICTRLYFNVFCDDY